VPSLNPIRLRGVSWALSVLDVRPKPDCDHRRSTTLRPMRVRLRMAWKHTCGSLPQACTATSPSLREGSSSSPAKAGMATSGAGLRAATRNGSPGRSNNDAPNPNVTVSDEGPRSSASPVSSGGASWSVLSVPTGRPAVMRREARVHSCSMPTSSSRSSVSTSYDANRSRDCAGVTIPAWCSPGKGTIGVSAAAPDVPSTATSATEETVAAASAPAPAVPRNLRRLTDRFPRGGDFTNRRPACRPARGVRPVRRSTGRAPSCRPGSARCTPRTWCPSCTVPARRRPR
jgi:hypothetical protein